VVVLKLKDTAGYLFEAFSVNQKYNFPNLLKHRFIFISLIFTQECPLAA